ncbi:MAG: DUF7931 domain-containing protein [Gammaproteobacteria bacterium]
MSEPAGDVPVLGTDAGLIDIERGDELARLSLAMVSQCRRRLDIVSRHLDPPVYDTDEFAEAVKHMALSSRRARIRLMIIDARPLVTSGHRLLDLVGRLPTYIELRAPAVQHQSFNEAFLIADKEGYIHRQFSDRPEGQADFADRRVAAGLSDRFEDMWERGVPETRFRRLHI